MTGGEPPWDPHDGVDRSGCTAGALIAGRRQECRAELADCPPAGPRSRRGRVGTRRTTRRGSRARRGRPVSATPSVRVRLLEQRAFRSMQLAELENPGRGGLAAAGPTEVRGALRVAALAALSDVEAALRRIE